MSSNRKPSIKDYWRIPGAAEKAPSPFHNYMSLKRFQAIHKLFTASSLSVNTSRINDLLKSALTPKRKPI
jgi:hypothetical protein